MKLAAFSPNSTWWAVALASIISISLLLTTACASTPTPTPVPPTATATYTVTPTATATIPTPTPTPGVGSLAKEVAAQVGQVVTAVDGSPDRVIVFGETHVSPAGQIEIAIMLNRMYERYGLRHIGLEGAFPKDGVLETTWFGPSLKAGEPIRTREDAIVGLLGGGEISSAEMMALVYGDMQVSGIDDKGLYDFEIPEKANNAEVVYLYKIAVPGMTPSDIDKCNALLNQNKTEEGIECVINSDQFTKDTYAKLNDTKAITSVEDVVKLLDDIEAKAEQVSADITSDDKSNLADVRRFYQNASGRSEAMVDNTLTLLKQFPGAPVAMTIGAAHIDGTVGLLKKAGVSFAVIEPKSLAEGRQNGDLSAEAFDRKLKVLSVDPPGGLGAVLDDRKKPPTIIETLAFKSKYELWWLTDALALAAAGGEPVPFDKTLKDLLPQLKDVTLAQDTLRIVGGDVIFKVIASDNNSQRVPVWVRTRAAKPAVQKLLEQRLKEELSSVQKKDTPDHYPPESDGSKPVLEPVSSDTIAKFSKSESAIRNTNLGG